MKINGRGGKLWCCCGEWPVSNGECLKSGQGTADSWNRERSGGNPWFLSERLSIESEAVNPCEIR